MKFICSILLFLANPSNAQFLPDRIHFQTSSLLSDHPGARLDHPAMPSSHRGWAVHQYNAFGTVGIHQITLQHSFESNCIAAGFGSSQAGTQFVLHYTYRSEISPILSLGIQLNTKLSRWTTETTKTLESGAQLEGYLVPGKKVQMVLKTGVRVSSQADQIPFTILPVMVIDYRISKSLSTQFFADVSGNSPMVFALLFESLNQYQSVCLSTSPGHWHTALHFTTQFSGVNVSIGLRLMGWVGVHQSSSLWRSAP